MARVIETKTIYDDSKPPCKSAAEMTELCCEPTGALQCCEVSEGEWHGYSDEEILEHLGIVLDAKGRDSQGRYVVIEKVPRTKPCGEKVIRYDFSQNNCCEDVEPLYWDMGITPEVLPHGSSIVIGWGGSDGRQVEVITSANGTWFAGGRKSAVGHGNSIELFAGATFCGATAVTVRDGCSEAVVVIRSDLGRWEFIGYSCGLGGASGTLIGTDGYGNRIIEAIAGNLKQLDYQAPKNSYDEHVYYGGLYHTTTPIADACPGFAESLCTNQEVMEWHCNCGIAAVAGQSPSPLCLSPNMQSITGTVCENSGYWIWYSGLLGLSCFGGSISGSVPGYVMGWLEGERSELFQWVC